MSDEIPMSVEPTATNDRAAARPNDLSGMVLGEFKLLRKLGRGGMGEVYLAEQVSLKRNVALKVLREDLVNDPLYLRRFEEEAKAVAPISHPNIVSVFAIGSDKAIRYMAMEYVQGMNLREYILKKGALELPVCLTVLRKVASALARASEEGIIHRDIKPENILLTKKGEVKVADFGLARQLNNENVGLTQTGVTMGTPLYMAPEQVQGLALDPRCDIYSLGVTCYHMLAGEPPYRGETAMAIAIQHVQGSPNPLRKVRPDMPLDLVRIVEKMMAVRREDRFASARELLRDLNQLRPGNGMTLAMPLPEASGETRAVASEALSVRSTVTYFQHAVKSPGAYRWLMPVTFAFALLLGAGLGWGLRPSRKVNAAVTSDRVLPDLSAVPNFATAREQWHYAQTLPDQQRELPAWAVITRFPHDDEQVLEASCHLFRDYLRLRRYPDALDLADLLAKRNNKRQQLVSHFLRGVVLGRQGRAEDSLESFRNALAIASDRTFLVIENREPISDELREWLTRIYFQTLNQDFVALGQPRDLSMVNRFWEFIQPRRSAP